MWGVNNFTNFTGPCLVPSAKISVNIAVFQQNGSKLRTQRVNHKLLKNWKYSVTAGRNKRSKWWNVRGKFETHHLSRYEGSWPTSNWQRIRSIVSGRSPKPWTPSLSTLPGGQSSDPGSVSGFQNSPKGQLPGPVLAVKALPRLLGGPTQRWPILGPGGTGPRCQEDHLTGCFWSPPCISLC